MTYLSSWTKAWENERWEKSLVRTQITLVASLFSILTAMGKPWTLVDREVACCVGVATPHLAPPPDLVHSLCNWKQDSDRQLYQLSLKVLSGWARKALFMPYRCSLTSIVDMDGSTKNDSLQFDDHRQLWVLTASLCFLVTLRCILKYQSTKGILLREMEPDCSPDAIREKTLKSN